FFDALIDLYLEQRQADLALDTAKTLASKSPDKLDVQLALGRTYLAMGDLASARSVLTGATRLAEYDAAMQVQIARLQQAAGDPDGAAYSVHKALQGRPDDPTALAQLVDIEIQRGDGEKANEALGLLMAKHPERVETAQASASLAMSRGQFPAAIAAYRAALAREESSENAIALARTYLAADQAGKAATFLEDWVKTRPADISAQKALAESQFRAGQLKAARQTYLNVVAVAGDDAPTLNNFANLLLQMNDPAAQEYAEKALTESPETPAFADTLGWILVRKGQVDAGLRYLREARLRNPENAEIRFHLAYALTKIGRQSEAKEDLQTALNGSGRLGVNPEVDQLRKELGI
ncbi:MAG: tetratricopeptide repeat protein, partial [Propionivibrio sp.]